MTDDHFRVSRKCYRGSGNDEKKARKSKNALVNRSTPDVRNNVAVSRLRSKLDLTVSEDLCLRSQHLSRLPDSFGARLTDLKTLDLSDNVLRCLPRSIKSLVKLKHLRLNDNRLWCLPLAVTELRSLVVLELANNRLTHLPHNLAQLRNLEILLIAGNHLSELPASCDGLSALRELDLSDNRIRRLGNFANLVRLDLACNRLERLPAEICQLAKLQVLDVQRNSLKKLPDAIGAMINLRELRANSNRLAGLPHSARKLTHLAYLDLYDNEFCEVPGDLRHMAKLVGLDIDKNRVDVDNFLIDGIEYEELRRSLRHRYRSEEHAREIGRKHEEPNIADQWKTTTECFASDLKERTRDNGEKEIEENWDVSDDSADEYDPTSDGGASRKSSTKYSYLEAISWGRLYCPADFHPPTIKQQIAERKRTLATQTEVDVDEGQFEDA